LLDFEIFLSSWSAVIQAVQPADNRHPAPGTEIKETAIGID